MLVLRTFFRNCLDNNFCILVSGVDSSYTFLRGFMFQILQFYVGTRIFKHFDCDIILTLYFLCALVLARYAILILYVYMYMDMQRNSKVVVLLVSSISFIFWKIMLYTLIVGVIKVLLNVQLSRIYKLSKANIYINFILLVECLSSSCS